MAPMRSFALLYLLLLLAGCATTTGDVADCLGTNRIVNLLQNLHISETRLHLDSADVARLTGASSRNGLATIERVPPMGICRCCVTFFYDESARVRELVIMRQLATRTAARQLAHEVVRAINLPPADVSTPGEDVALYRWNTRDDPHEQLALDISITDEPDGKITFRAALSVIGRKLRP